jgi:hypothetical protein
MRGPDLQFNPLGDDSENPLSYLERFVQKVLDGAFQVIHTSFFGFPIDVQMSRFFQVKHVPNDCRILHYFGTMP